jgi:LacI family transcriptional regulator
MPPPSIRSLARQLGLSAATVSLALRDNPRVVAATRRRVHQAAARAGYRPNPLVGSVLTAVRRAGHAGFQGALMAINHTPTVAAELLPFHREVLAGAERRAAEMGYSLTLAWEGPHHLSLRRLNAILAARGIRGALVLPFPETRDFTELDWGRLSGVVMDCCLSAPALHTVLPDHQLSMQTAVARLAALGYRRPGLMVARWRDARVRHRWSGGFFSACAGNFGTIPVPELADPERGPGAFAAWVRRHRPDAVIAHAQLEVKEWLGELGLAVPRDVGFVALNRVEATGPCAALDLQPALLGAAAIESVVAQMQRNERGVPAVPKTITLAARWVDGPTLREAAPPSRRSEQEVR